MAMTHQEERLQRDPLARAFDHRSIGDVVPRLQEALLDSSRAPDDPSTPLLYELLLRSGAATADCHLVMARHLARTGEAARAERLVSALTALEPFHRGAWKLSAQLARARGDEAGARRAELEADAALVAEPLNFLERQTGRG